MRELEAQLKTSQTQGRDFDTLQKQASQQAQEYNRLADEHIKAVSSSKVKTDAASDENTMPGGIAGWASWAASSTVRRRGNRS